MASNKEIAIQWAKQWSLQPKLVYSDKFFNPFNDNMRLVIVRQLAKQGIIAWWDTKNGAFIFREDNPGFKFSSFEEKGKTYSGGTFEYGPEDNTTVVILPILEAAE